MIIVGLLNCCYFMHHIFFVNVAPLLVFCLFSHSAWQKKKSDYVYIFSVKNQIVLHQPCFGDLPAGDCTEHGGWDPSLFPCCQHNFGN